MSHQLHLVQAVHTRQATAMKLTVTNLGGLPRALSDVDLAVTLSEPES